MFDRVYFYYYKKVLVSIVKVMSRCSKKCAVFKLVRVIVSRIAAVVGIVSNASKVSIVNKWVKYYAVSTKLYPEFFSRSLRQHKFIILN